MNIKFNIKQRKNMTDLKKLKNLQINTPQLEASSKISTNKQRRQCAYLVIGLSALAALSILPEIAFAAKFDIDAGVKASTDPLIKAVSDHWGKAVLLTGCAGAVIGEGDARQRAVRAAITSASAGGVVLALLAMLT
jgi:hypothetical protein